MVKLGRIYICSPLSAPTKAEVRANMLSARRYCRLVEKFTGGRAYAPHAWLPDLLEDSIPEDRTLALSFGIELLSTCDTICVCGERISSGMHGEIEYARRTGKRIIFLKFRKRGDTA